ncbi:MAG TPA: HAD-IIA family hydrolase [Actinomycetaceae bacterium]|nr:HAD-IIA family hydrolase [Actinomycetaceae bacterium]
MTHTLLSSEAPLSEAYDVGLMDLDGVMYEGQRPIEYAAEGAARARELGMRLTFVTNNASRSPQTVADQLVSLDISATADEIYSSAMAAVELAIQRHGPGARVLAIGGEGLIEAIASSDLVAVDSADDDPEAVIQGFRPTICWSDLSEAAYAIGRGADFIATNLDSTLPQERGLAVGNGSLVAAVANATGKTPVSAGKPEPEIFRLGSRRADARRPLTVGDRLNTDIAGSNASGIPSLHVVTGVSSARDVVKAIAIERPSYLGLDLRDLSRPHPPVNRDGDWFACRDARASVSDGVPVLGRKGGEFRLTGPAVLAFDEYRAVAVAVWNTSDDVAVPEFTVVDQ